MNPCRQQNSGRLVGVAPRGIEYHSHDEQYHRRDQEPLKERDWNSALEPFQLESVQRGSLDITAWIAWFLRCLDRAIQDADETLGSVFHKAKLWQRIDRNPVNKRQRQVINRMLDNFKGHLTTSKYAKLAKCSTDTALRDIRDLLERGIIVKNPGGGRSSSYRLAEPDDVPV